MNELFTMLRLGTLPLARTRVLLFMVRLPPRVYDLDPNALREAKDAQHVNRLSQSLVS
jgi:hypothetical protein